MQRPWGRSKVGTQASPRGLLGMEWKEQRERQFNWRSDRKQGLVTVRATAFPLCETGATGGPEQRSDISWLGAKGSLSPLCSEQNEGDKGRSRQTRRPAVTAAQTGEGWPGPRTTVGVEGWGRCCLV